MPSKKTVKPGLTAAPEPAAPAPVEPVAAPSLRDFRNRWRAPRTDAITVNGLVANVTWHPLTDAETEPIRALTRRALPPLKPGATPEARPEYDLQDPEYLQRRYRCETQARALVVFYAVPELRAEFLGPAGGRQFPAPQDLTEADVAAVAEFLCGPTSGMPPEFLLVVARLVLRDFDVAEAIEAQAAVF